MQHVLHIFQRKNVIVVAQTVLHLGRQGFSLTWPLEVSGYNNSSFCLLNGLNTILFSYSLHNYKMFFQPGEHNILLFFSMF